MNPYLMLGSAVLYFVTAIGAFFYGEHVEKKACDGRVEQVQLDQAKQNLATTRADEQAAVKTATDTNAITGVHADEEAKVEKATQPAQVQVRIIHDRAPVADCLRQSVDPAVDQQLRNATAAAPSGTPADRVP